MTDAQVEPVYLSFDPDDHTAALDALSSSDMQVLGRLHGSSNATLAVRLMPEGWLAVYKPAAGERPLADFELGTLPAREVAAYELSRRLGWNLVPPTVMREDGPFGMGSLQIFIEHDPEEHAFTLFESRREDLKPVVLFDVVANNADRKSGHVIRDIRTDRIWAIDNGLTFHEEPKLRTVLWPFAGQSIEERLLAPVRALTLGSVLTELLTETEIHALEARREALVGSGSYPPEPEDRYPYPWPPI